MSRVFGSMAYVHVPDQLRTKWDTKSREPIFVGYCLDARGYQLIDPKKPRKVVNARDVILENKTYQKTAASQKGDQVNCVPVHVIPAASEREDILYDNGTVDLVQEAETE
jgi:hypothetical protein